LSVSPTDEMLSGQSVDTSSVDRELSSMMEILFTRASDILDLHVYSYKGNIKIFPTLYELTNYYNNLYHSHVPCTGYAFYIVDDKSIYISAQFFRREILGHEIGHAIMSSYFVVQPSIKIQEVLAGYIEYQLRKSK
jgi:Zn-dependent peptidase ImmA (M78 family)